ncbi:hypothetical protein Pla108_04110 [Botrimarina colliarenosi]|uniref:Uncharacterized protein n=1 Tax=Botrimarina colliarenosi TaxID=2528001 RepID=A0A5C6AHF5_9BACT|nr:hypothetical protein Pla108_04110 [Botrimarina colliarenosi]
MGEHGPLGVGLDQPQEPLVADGRLDDDLVGPQFAEEGLDSIGLDAPEPPRLKHLARLTHDTNTDRLLVEVHADVIHDGLLQG